MSNLPLLLSTPDVLSFIGIGRSKWDELREEYKIKPVTRGGKGFIYRGEDIQRIWVTPENDVNDDAIMKGLEELG